MCTEIIETNHDVTKAWYRRGESSLNLDELKDAMDDFANILRLEPKTSEVYKKAENKIEICKLLEACSHKTNLQRILQKLVSTKFLHFLINWKPFMKKRNWVSFLGFSLLLALIISPNFLVRGLPLNHKLAEVGQTCFQQAQYQLFLQALKYSCELIFHNSAI